MLLLMNVERDSEGQGPSPWAQVYSNTLMFLHFSPSDSFGVLSLQCGGRESLGFLQGCVWVSKCAW